MVICQFSKLYNKINTRSHFPGWGRGLVCNKFYHNICIHLNKAKYETWYRKYENSNFFSFEKRELKLLRHLLHSIILHIATHSGAFRICICICTHHGCAGWYTELSISLWCGRRVSLHWRHNDYGGVSNHQTHKCLLNRLCRRSSKKTPKLCVTGLCAGKSPGPANSPHKGPVTRKMFPFDDVIMSGKVRHR